MGQEVPAKHNAINIKAKNRANKRKRQTWRFLFSSAAQHVGQALWGSGGKDKIESRTYLYTFL